jgi:dihydroxyacetone kinase
MLPYNFTHDINQHVFTHQVAGAAAASGASLGEVVAAAKEAASLVKSLGTAFTTCTVPGTVSEWWSERGQKEMSACTFHVSHSFISIFFWS